MMATVRCGPQHWGLAIRRSSRPAGAIPAHLTHAAVHAGCPHKRHVQQQRPAGAGLPRCAILSRTWPRRPAHPAAARGAAQPAARHAAAPQQVHLRVQEGGQHARCCGVPFCTQRNAAAARHCDEMSPRLTKRIAGLIFWKPRTPGLRHKISIDYKALGVYTGPPVPGLSFRKANTGGRNAHGHITVRGRGGGIKKVVRMVDWTQGLGPHAVPLRPRGTGGALRLLSCATAPSTPAKPLLLTVGGGGGGGGDAPTSSRQQAQQQQQQQQHVGVVQRIEHDPNRTGFLALVRYESSGEGQRHGRAVRWHSAERRACTDKACVRAAMRQRRAHGHRRSCAALPPGAPRAACGRHGGGGHQPGPAHPAGQPPAAPAHPAGRAHPQHRDGAPLTPSFRRPLRHGGACASTCALSGTASSRAARAALAVPCCAGARGRRQGGPVSGCGGQDPVQGGPARRAGNALRSAVSV